MLHTASILELLIEMIEGDLPARALSMVKEWAKKHRADLLEIWETQEFKQLPPLE